MRRLLIAFALGCYCCAALPCRIRPANLYRDHADIIGNTSVIVLAEAVSIRDGDRDSCQFRAVRSLKGRAPEEISIPCRSRFEGESITDFSAHNDSAFWQHRMGRVTYDTTCKLLPPTFVAGHKYLLFLDVLPDTKQFEEIVEPDDKWLLFVEQSLLKSKQ